MKRLENWAKPIAITMKPHLVERVTKAAKERGLNRSEFVRQAVLEKLAQDGQDVQTQKA